MMTATDVAAWIGALTGTLALLWDVFKWVQSGASIDVSASGHMITIGAGLTDGKGPFVSIEARNIGDGKTTLTNVVGLYYSKWWRKVLRHPAERNFIVSNPLPGRLPHVLEPGERWIGLMEQTDELVEMSRKGWLYCGVFHSMAKRPVVVRLVIQPRGANASP